MANTRKVRINLFMMREGEVQFDLQCHPDTYVGKGQAFEIVSANGATVYAKSVITVANRSDGITMARLLVDYDRHNLQQAIALLRAMPEVSNMHMVNR
jgi:hypothetical protein